MNDIKWTKFSDKLPEKEKDIFCFVNQSIVLYSMDEVQIFTIEEIGNNYDLWAYVPIPDVPIIEPLSNSKNITVLWKSYQKEKLSQSPEYQRCDHCNTYPKLEPINNPVTNADAPKLNDNVKPCDYCAHWFRDPMIYKFSCPKCHLTIKKSSQNADATKLEYDLMCLTADNNNLIHKVNELEKDHEKLWEYFKKSLDDISSLFKRNDELSLKQEYLENNYLMKDYNDRKKIEIQSCLNKGYNSAISEIHKRIEKQEALTSIHQNLFEVHSALIRGQERKIDELERKVEGWHKSLNATDSWCKRIENQIVCSNDERLPKVGDIVHFYDIHPKPKPAMVIFISSTNSIRLRIFLGDYPHEQRFDNIEQSCPYSKEPKPGHWSWPQ